MEPGVRKLPSGGVIDGITLTHLRARWISEALVGVPAPMKSKPKRSRSRATRNGEVSGYSS